jgi:non-canonical purine NTP pyrophosphatase (RdgB/HAM1 family)
MTRLLLATRNAGKLRELLGLLEGEPIEIATLGEYAEIHDVEESGRSFEENAQLKATHAARAAHLWALGEDSGLEVDALGGRPGVYSARYAGVHGDDAANNAKLVRELARSEDRSARYVCVMALASPEGQVVATSRGVCEGQIVLEPRGSSGFGYDPHFIPELTAATMAELDREAKAALSHRGQALRAMLAQIRIHVAGVESAPAVPSAPPPP